MKENIRKEAADFTLVLASFSARKQRKMMQRSEEKSLYFNSLLPLVLKCREVRIGLQQNEKGKRHENRGASAVAKQKDEVMKSIKKKKKKAA